MTVEDKKKLEKELQSEECKLDIPIETIIEQVETFRKGISPVRIVKACTIDDGIKIIPEFGDFINQDGSRRTANQMIDRVIGNHPAAEIPVGGYAGQL